MSKFILTRAKKIKQGVLENFIMDLDSAVQIIIRDDLDTFIPNYINFLGNQGLLERLFEEVIKTGNISANTKLFEEDTSLLAYAIYFKANNIVDYIHTSLSSLDPEQIHYRNSRPLCHYAAASGNIDYLNKYIDYSGLVDNGSANIVNVAAFYNQPEVIRWGLDHSISADVRTKEYKSPLRVSCEKYQLRCLEIICQDPAVKKSLGNNTEASTIVLTCLNKRFFEALPILIKNGLNIVNCAYDQWYLLFHGASSNSDNIPTQLLRFGDIINKTDNAGWTGLHVAASKHSIANVKFFLNNGISPFQKTCLKSTPFMLANTYDKNDPKFDCSHAIKTAIAKEMCKKFLKDRLVVTDNQ